jgi:hypothetical protein
VEEVQKTGNQGQKGAMAMAQKVPNKWELAVAALLAEKTVEDAAMRIGVGYRTLKGWLALPEFQELYRAARRNVLERNVARLLALTDKALDKLDKNLECDSPAAVNKAIELTLAHATKGMECLDLLDRVKNLEERLKGKPT